MSTSSPWGSETMSSETEHGKRDFADVIKLRILIWGEYPELSRRAQGNHKGPYRTETRWSGSEIGRGYAAGLEDGGRNHEPRRAGDFWKPERERDWILP